MAQVNIRLETQLHRKAKLLAVMRKESLNDLLARAIASAVERDKKAIRQLLD